MPIATNLKSFSNIKSPLILNPFEGNTDFFITGYNSLLANDDTRVARDFYLLLMVYVNYFCFPVLSFVLNCLGGFGKSIQCKFSEISRLVMAITFFVENKKYISILPFLRKGQVESFFLPGDIYCKTVLL